jgi:hypothetical protein
MDRKSKRNKSKRNKSKRNKSKSKNNKLKGGMVENQPKPFRPLPRYPPLEKQTVNPENLKPVENQPRPFRPRARYNSRLPNPRYNPPGIQTFNPENENSFTSIGIGHLIRQPSYNISTHFGKVLAEKIYFPLTPNVLKEINGRNCRLVYRDEQLVNTQKNISGQLYYNATGKLIDIDTFEFDVKDKKTVNLNELINYLLFLETESDKPMNKDDFDEQWGITEWDDIQKILSSETRFNEKKIKKMVGTSGQECIIYSETNNNGVMSYKKSRGMLSADNGINIQLENGDTLDFAELGRFGTRYMLIPLNRNTLNPLNRNMSIPLN